MTEEYYTEKGAEQPRLPVITSRIQTDVVCPHCQKSGYNGPSFVLATRYNRRCLRCRQELPKDPDLPVHESVRYMLCALSTYGFLVQEFLEELGVACGSMVPQRVVKLFREKDGMTASVRWFEIERPTPLIGLDWRSLMPNPGQAWSMGFGNKLRKQGMPDALWSICQQVNGCVGFKVTERQLRTRCINDDKPLFLRLEHRSHLGIIPGIPHEHVYVVVRVEFTWPQSAAE
ncbi:MAG: hypothetical protein K2W82_17110 [Candidatus Obscuribacterales bacterium]|nr:hypothetical protein [Candidatus Obscuribacterales bacterium]